MSYQDALSDAQTELGRRAHREFDDGGDPLVGVLFEQLAEVADYTRRVGLPTASKHYRCDKSYPLVAAAVAVMRQAFVINATDDAAAEMVEETTGLLQDLARAMIPVLWSATSGWTTGVIDADEARRARGVAEAVRVWAEKVAAHAQPVDEDGGVW